MLLDLCRPFVPHHAAFSHRTTPQDIHSRSSIHQVLIATPKHRRPRIDRLSLHRHLTSRQDLLLPRINILDHLLQLMAIHLRALDTRQRMALMGQPRTPIGRRTRAPRRRARVQKIKRKRRKNTSQALALRESIEPKTPARPQRIALTRLHPVQRRAHTRSIRCHSHLYLGHQLHSVSKNT